MSPPKASDGKQVLKINAGAYKAHRAAPVVQSKANELIASLRFSPAEGRIWFDDQAVAMVRSTSLSSLHRELVETLGQLRAGHFLADIGYASGARDALLARKLYPDAPLQELIEIGPRLRSVRGIVSMRPVRQELDLPSDHFYSEATFSGDFEADTQLANDGMANSPVCWMQVGFATGFASTLLGRPAIYKEVECRATGSRNCRVVGRLLEEWHANEIAEEIRCVPPEMLGDHEPAAARETSCQADPLDEAAEVLPGGILSISPGFQETCEKVRKVSVTNATVLLLGETGVGKEVLARAIHLLGARKDKPFVALNCGAIPNNLIEAELFGVEKAAFTGATQSRPGRFERAQGGTLFLDEIGTLSMSAQIKLLRAIQEREIERVGDTLVRKVDVRIIAATNDHLQDAIAEGRFREDLLYRLNIFPINIPPLRDRREDIHLLMRHFLSRYNQRHGKNVTGFTESAIAAFNQYEYPGNIRELENLVERAVILVDSDQPVDFIHLYGVEGLTHSASTVRLPPDVAVDTSTENGNPFYSAMLDEMITDGTPINELEYRLIKKAMAKADDNLSQAARLLGMTRPQLAYRLKKHQSGGIGTQPLAD